jgi:hypothetical protein
MKQLAKLQKPRMRHYNGLWHMFLRGYCYFATSKGNRKYLAKG